MIPKKVRKIISIIIAVMLVMAVFPAVSFADDGFFGNGDENVASSGDAAEDESISQDDEGITPDQATTQSEDKIENNETSQQEEDTNIELTRNRGNSGGNMDAVSSVNSLDGLNNDQRIVINFSFSPDKYDGGVPVYVKVGNLAIPNDKRPQVSFNYSYPSGTHFEEIINYQKINSSGGTEESSASFIDKVGTYKLTASSRKDGDYQWTSAEKQYKIVAFDSSEVAFSTNDSNRDENYTSEGIAYPAYYSDGNKYPIMTATYSGGELPSGCVLRVFYRQYSSKTWTEDPGSETAPTTNGKYQMLSRLYSTDGTQLASGAQKAFYLISRPVYLVRFSGTNSAYYDRSEEVELGAVLDTTNVETWYNEQYLSSNKVVKCWRNKADDSVVDFSKPVTADMFNASLMLDVYAEWKHAHELTKHDKTPVSCTSIGTKEYWSCSTCGKLFSDEDGMNPITQPEPYTDPNAHTYANPEFTWTGVTGCTLDMECINCHNSSVHLDATKIESTVKAATCTEAGNGKYTAYFENGYHDTKTEYYQPLGHDWDTPTYVWEDDNSSVTATRVCGRDSSHKEQETVKPQESSTATCTEAGVITYTATFTSAAFAQQTKEMHVDALGHSWGNVTYVWSDDNSEVTASRKCERDDSHIESETVKTTKTVTKEATESEPGDEIYTAEFENTAFEKQTKYVEIPAKGSSEKKDETKKDETKKEETKEQEPSEEDHAFYINTSGDKITWTVGSNEPLIIKFERSEDNASTSKHFLGIEVDGKATSKDLYDTEDGSIIIKLKPALLENLGEGEHTLTALFDDGSASAKFTIIKATKEVKNEKKTTSKNAKTGDASPIKLVIIIMIVSALACAGVLVIKKKRQ